MVAVLVRRLGIAHLEEAEDVASATFVKALEVWPYQGVPENPVAWLYAVARNQARNHMLRIHLFETKVADKLALTYSEGDAQLDLSEQGIQDSQLRMMFAICHPSLSTEAQVGLALRVLCGFGIDEIATAFLSNKETINKRLFRAREVLREQKMELSLPAESQIKSRLESVLTTLYLLFNEGYYSESGDQMIRTDLCEDAIRLTEMLLTYAPTAVPKTHALLALMCFQSSRLHARTDEAGLFVTYDQQDTTKWDAQLIQRGAYHLHLASQGESYDRYHLEATIAWWHTLSPAPPDKWKQILKLHDLLIEIEPSPMIQLNRTMALSRAYGKVKALDTARSLNLNGNRYYHMLMGDLLEAVDQTSARMHFEKALSAAKSPVEHRIITDRLARVR